MNESSLIDPILKWADRVGALSTSSILALVCIYLGWERHSDRKAISEDQAKRNELRVRDSEVNLLTARALEKLSDSYEKLETVISERLPHA